MSTLLRPLSTGELLDRTFFLYRGHFAVFAGIAAITELPVLALRLGNSALIAERVFVPRLVTISIILLGTFLAVAVSHAWTVIAVSELHLDRKVSIRSAFAAARRGLLRVVWISLVVTFVVPMFIGMLAGTVVGAILVPMSVGRVGAVPAATILVALSGAAAATYWWLPRALVVPVTVLEGTGMIDSMARSGVLTEDRRGRIFVIIMLVLALNYAITLLFQSPAYFIGGLHIIRGQLVASTWSSVIMAIGAFAGASLAGPILTIALTLVYYDERVRREGFDLQFMMASLAPIPENTVVTETA